MIRYMVILTRTLTLDSFGMSGRGIAPGPGTTSSVLEAYCNKSQVTQSIKYNGEL